MKSTFAPIIAAAIVFLGVLVASAALPVAPPPVHDYLIVEQKLLEPTPEGTQPSIVTIKAGKQVIYSGPAPNFGFYTRTLKEMRLDGPGAAKYEFQITFDNGPQTEIYQVISFYCRDFDWTADGKKVRPLIPADFPLGGK